MLIKSVLSATVIAMLGGCVSDQATMDELSRFNGVPLEQFVIANGAPGNSYKLADGDTIYYWSSSKSVYVPGSSVTNFSGSQAYTQQVSGGDINTECQLDLLTDPQGVIRKVTMRKNTIGYWTSSACHEYVRSHDEM
ncbi:hypothetical protein ACFSKY_22710 [Azotobacter chroococcum]|uniref:Uncharacterized protein n=1 Tax=Azotobacter chroococcum TaxID=353 RepID=A0A4R1P688_9GAMM|nr:hypothetical protein [Azotobacter chroococcum]TBV95314.1 hypothetical protein E0E53_13170 [Azotobacter chroococcum]TCL22053.1 hypothetical protein EV691_1352 [Azotobacter chroococcum]